MWSKYRIFVYLFTYFKFVDYFSMNGYFRANLEYANTLRVVVILVHVRRVHPHAQAYLQTHMYHPQTPIEATYVTEVKLVETRC
jgi:hypothetical protein